MEQLKAFRDFEGDRWFRQNILGYDYSPQDDAVLNLIKEYRLTPRRFLEIGCSAGYRVNEVNKQFPTAQCYGIDPSPEAIKHGKLNYPDIHIMEGSADRLEFVESFFDVVVVGFVFYVIDRELLYRTIHEIDRVLATNGFVIIMDFFSSRPVKKTYHHISAFNAYSFKQNYESMFLSSGMYQLIDKTTLSHSSPARKDAVGAFDDLISLTLLRKDINDAY